ncbi:MAG TPA: VOC family protein [Stellaceae bacterium]|jgi:hypothetical protein|nr:VOC family protein [Stellaceae bacterium]
MAHGITGIDHILVGVDNLDDAAQTWQRLGFTLTPRGRHLGWGTGNYCIMFPDEYIELLGIIDAGQFTNGLDRFLESQGEGGLGLSWGSKDAEASAASLAASGTAMGEIRDLARQLELPEGTVLPRFKLAWFTDADTATPGLSSFITQHLTPTMIRKPGWLMHANGAIALKGVTIRHPDPMSLVEAYEKVFGMSAVNTTDSVMTVHVGRQRLIFAGTDDLEVLHPEIDFADLGQDEGPRMVLATLASHDLDLTADHMAGFRVDYEEQRDGSVIVLPEAASGIALEFVKP